MHFTAHSLDHTRRKLFYDSCLSGASFTRRNPIAVAIEMPEILRPARWHIAYSFRVKLINEGELESPPFRTLLVFQSSTEPLDFDFQQRPRAKCRKTGRRHLTFGILDGAFGTSINARHKGEAIKAPRVHQMQVRVDLERKALVQSEISRTRRQ
jgi:hypothetical protein